jgi:hypothetical protein
MMKNGARNEVSEDFWAKKVEFFLVKSLFPSAGPAKRSRLESLDIPL